VTSRRILLDGREDREIEVCWKHAEGDIDLETLSPMGD
jgi:hypothetical protein